ncbi:PREDICTED: uncharacterized protein LOC108562893 [Nicrophorus vespilloides]|uniref:Uncharacterized protein LOC108562893 n=1 Tax=Nicrophorus vespilloides TaxID=110193 RepID=A0ABM1MQM9_NICVS|nr:PREDICTED: uncharacterized protein LOC108562893 [Nicrophorus vespilloides]
MANDSINVKLEIPFPTNRLAQIVYDVLKVDQEPKRSGVKKELSVSENILKVKFVSSLARQSRVAVNSFFESLNLIVETIDFIGEPTSEEYTHF